MRVRVKFGTKSAFHSMGECKCPHKSGMRKLTGLSTGKLLTASGLPPGTNRPAPPPPPIRGYDPQSCRFLLAIIFMGKCQ